LKLLHGITVDNSDRQLYYFLYNKTKQMNQFPKFTPAWHSTCFGQFLCPSSRVYSLYTRHWYMSYMFEDSFRKRTEKLPETCRVSCRSKFGKLVHLVGFIIKKFVKMHCHMNVKKLYYLCLLILLSILSLFIICPLINRHTYTYRLIHLEVHWARYLHLIQLTPRSRWPCGLKRTSAAT
jgi:hypothetical protein